MDRPLNAAVIGAGPAGGMAALLLARRGWDVTLIEQSQFPRDKVCGECVSALGMSVLDRAGLKYRFLEAGAVRLTHAALHPPAGRPAFVLLPQPMWGLSRAALDALLLAAAHDAGATIRQPARCESLVASEAPGVALRVRDLKTNTVSDLNPEWALVADGKSALCGATHNSPKPTGDFGIKAHFDRISGPRDAIELFTTLGTYGGLAAIESGRWNAAFSVPAGMLREHHGDVTALFARLIDSNKTLRNRLAGARRVSQWLASPLPRFAVTDHWPWHVIPVGNAAAALEPIGGEGMGLAMRSAELAADALADPSEFRPQRLRAEFNALWKLRRAGCRAAAKVVSSPKFAGIATEVLAQDAFLRGLSLLAIGKG